MKNVRIGALLFLALTGPGLAQDGPDRCPDSVSHFQLAKWYPDSCGKLEPPGAARLSAGLAEMEGVWTVQLTSERGTESWQASLSKGLSAVGHRDPTGEWLLIGQFRTYPVIPAEVSAGGLVTDFHDGDGGHPMSVSGSSLSGVFSGQWTRRDEVRAVSWHRLPSPRITTVQFHSNLTDNRGAPVVHSVDIGTGGAALAPGRIERPHPVTCGYGHMRGNCPRVYIRIFGENLARPIPIWLNPASHMELLETRFLYGEGSSFPTDAAMKWIITGEPVVESIRLEFALWDGATPGRYVLWIGDQPVPFDLVLHGYPTIRPVEISTLTDVVVESFAENPPYEGTITGPGDDEPDGRAYRMILEVPLGRGSGTIRSDDPTVVQVVGESIGPDAVDPSGRIRRIIVARETGETGLNLDWTLADGSTYSTRVKIAVSPIDLKLEGVPDHAEFDAGGFIPMRNMIRATLTIPSGNKSSLAVLKGGDQIRMWLDANRQRPVALVPNDSGVPVASWGVGKAPPFVYIEGVKQSSRVREVELRLAAASGLLSWRPFEIVGRDDAVLTVMDLRLVLGGDPDWDPSVPYLIGQNSDDDDGDLELDLYASTIPVLMEDELVSLTVRSRPPMPVTFGEVDLTIGRGLSLWTDREKGEGNALISDLQRDAPNTLRLHSASQNQELYLEGVSVSGSPAQLELEIRPSYLVRGIRTAVGEPMRARHEILVVEADIDIDGVPDDQYDEEYDLGGSVTVLGAGERTEDQLTRLDLRVTRNLLRRAGASLEIRSGADKIRLLQRRGIADFVPVELTSGEDGTASIVYASPDQVPGEIFVEGLAMSEDREVEVALSYLEIQANGLQREVASDRIRLTVWPSNLLLAPVLVTALTDTSRSGRAVPLSAQFGFVDEENPGIDVTAHRNTEYEWVGKGLPSYLVNGVIAKLREGLKSTAGSDFGLGLADVSIDERGVLTINSPGIQIIRAKHQGIPSNRSLVLSGFKLKSIELVPGPPDYPGVPDLIERSTLANALSGIISDPEHAWLVVTADETGYWWDKGMVRLEDVTFEFLDGGPTISLNDLLDAIEPVLAWAGSAALAPLLGPGAPVATEAILKTMRSDLKQLLNEFVSFESSEPTIARQWLLLKDRNRAIPAFSGIIKGFRPGFADISGTLDLGELGKKDDVVTTWVLPQIEVVDIVAEDDDDNHAKPILLDQRREAGGSRQIWARARGRIADLAPVSVLDDLVSIAPESLRQRSVNLPLKALGQEFRIVGELVVRSSGDDDERYFIRNADLIYDVPNALMEDGAWSVAPPNRVRIEDESPADAFRRRLSAEAGAPDSIAEIGVTVSLPALGEASNSRGVAVVAAATVCEVGSPRYLLASAAADADERFDGSPYAEALAAIPGNLARIRPPSGLGTYPPSSRALPPGGPYTAGRIYAVEVPVNDADLCRLHERHDSVASDDGPAAAVYSTTVTGRYRNPGESRYKEALIYIGARGWVNERTEGKLVDRVLQRFSVKDLGRDAWLVTSTIVFQMMVDASGERAGFGSVLHAASPFADVGEEWDHYNSALNAATRFRSIPDPPIHP